MTTASRPPITAERWARLSPVIDATLDLPPAERAAHVERACAGDPMLRADLERFLAECERGDSLVDRAAAERFALLLEEPEEALPALLSQRYAMEGEIGRGGMGRVYLARDRKHDRHVAVKVWRRGLRGARFLREIGVAARLSHPYIVPLHDSGATGEFLYYVMPHVRGETLRQRLEREPRLPVDFALRVARDVAGALDYAHANGIVHRDVKPENIMLSDGHALVMDFGIAGAIGPAGDDEGASGSAMGTPAYMAPEQVRERFADARADVYSLGCVVYEMLAGEQPFRGATTAEVLERHARDPVPLLRAARADVPAAVERAVQRALSKSPADRFPTTTAFVDACGD